MKKVAEKMLERTKVAQKLLERPKVAKKLPSNLCESLKVGENKELYSLINTCDVGRTLEEFVNHEPASRDLQILLVFFQHPAWFIRL